MNKQTIARRMLSWLILIASAALLAQIVAVNFAAAQVRSLNTRGRPIPQRPQSRTS